MNGPTARAHEDWLDLVAVLALGALGEAEAREVRAHLAICEACCAEYAALRPAADLVGYAAEKKAPDEVTARRMCANVLAAAGARAPSAGPARRALVWPAYVAAAAAILVAGFAVVDDANVRGHLGSLAERNGVLERRVAQTDADAAHERAAIADLTAPGTVRYPIAGGDVFAHDGRLYVAISKMPPPPKGKVYQAWILARGAATVSPDVTFVPDASGVAVVKLSKNAGAVAAVAVSLEPEGGSQQPTSKPIFIRKLS